MPDSLLKTIEACYDESQWLQAHADDVYQGIRTALFTPYLLHRGIDLLVKIFPSVVLYYDLSLWLELLYEALLEVMKLRDHERLTQIWTFMGAGQLSQSEPEKASRAYQVALTRAEESNTADAMVEAYIGLFRVQTFRHDADFDDKHIRHALELSDLLGNPDLKPCVYMMIGGVYRSRGDTTTALGYCQTALAWWFRQGRLDKLAPAAFNLAVIYRQIGHQALAETYLDLAQEWFLQTNYPSQYGLIAYEQGSLCRKQGDFEGAVQWREIALREFVYLNPPSYRQHYLAMTYHALGNAYAGLKQFHPARANLRKALSLWREMDNQYQQAQVWLSLGCVEGCQGRRHRARLFLKQAASLSEHIADNALRDELRANIAASRAELDEYLLP